VKRSQRPQYLVQIVNKYDVTPYRKATGKHGL
jgi:hypothetical protein